MSGIRAFAVIERARKAARISEFDRLVPPAGERSGKYWGKYNAALQNLLDDVDKEIGHLAERHSDMTDKYAATVAELAECKEKLSRAGVEAVANRIGLNDEQVTLLVAG
jgi:hypothetical protein